MSRSSLVNRTKLRAAHLVLAAVTFVAVYSPVLDAEASRVILRVVAFPGLAMSGVALWKVAAVRRWLAARRSETLLP